MEAGAAGLNLQKLLEDEAALDTSSDEENSQAGSDRDAEEATSDGEEEGEGVKDEASSEEDDSSEESSASDSDSDSEEAEEAAPAEGESEFEPEEEKKEEEEGRKAAQNVLHKPISSTSRVLEPPKAKRAKITTPDAAEKRATKERKGRENGTRTGGERASKHVDFLQPPRRPTLSVAVTSEMLAGCEGEDKVHVVGRLARTLVAFSVDEVVVIGSGMDAAYMLKMLQYLECPPHLRAHFFSEHK